MVVATVERVSGPASLRDSDGSEGATSSAATPAGSPRRRVARDRGRDDRGESESERDSDASSQDASSEEHDCRGSDSDAGGTDDEARSYAALPAGSKRRRRTPRERSRRRARTVQRVVASGAAAETESETELDTTCRTGAHRFNLFGHLEIMRMLVRHALPRPSGGEAYDYDATDTLLPHLCPDINAAATDDTTLVDVKR